MWRPERALNFMGPELETFIGAGNKLFLCSRKCLSHISSHRDGQVVCTTVPG